MVSVSRHNCLKRPPAVPLGWCQKRTVGAVLVKMTPFCRLFGGLGGVLGGVDRKMCSNTCILFTEKSLTILMRL